MVAVATVRAVVATAPEAATAAARAARTSLELREEDMTGFLSKRFGWRSGVPGTREGQTVLVDGCPAGTAVGVPRQAEVAVGGGAPDAGDDVSGGGGRVTRSGGVAEWPRARGRLPVAGAQRTGGW
ncbi:hypothetical protein Kpho02_68090 [Kitasatospora phosalacinea]|uniref:Uncharacterized protein n=1 Tax=Kitasatospora phosalacinea TaxID=2065 RepID=A0A9W6QGF5_9ACTN|nr:hypothetical protein Kpho02_68090 [Kitasatospora phosalacinea]